MLKLLKKRPKNMRLWTNVALFGGGVFVLMIGIIIIWLSSLQIPDFQSFDDRKTSSSTKIYDRTGEILLYDIYQDARKTNVSLDQMGENIKEATIAIEDSEFYNHPGVRITSTVRAVLSNLFGFGIGGGGSTITQQLVKNSLLTPKKSPIRKVKEWVLAYKIDRSMTKDKILEYYLNDNPYGGTIYGVEEASKSYFNKSAKDLTVAEAAYLAAIPQSPTLLSPYGKNKARLDTRKNLVLSRMEELGFITEEEYEAAKNQIVDFAPQAKVGIKAPHFVFFVKEYLEQKYGNEMIERGGLKVISTIDYTLQEKGEQFVKEGAIENAKLWNGENAGLVAIDPKTGQILTMVGSRDYFDKEIDGNYNTATALRQPGSAFKPFIYATAFTKGFTPETVLFDLPTEFNASCSPTGEGNNCYMPDNYDGKFRGPMSLRNALAQSINVPAVKLFYLAGLSDSLKVAEDMGITTLGEIERYGLTLVIGGGEVSLVDITSAYGVLANSGVRNPYTPILRIENGRGEVIEEFTPKSKEVISRGAALTVSDILKDNTARIPTFGANSQLNIPGAEVAVKTGTTNSNRDAWTIGYTPGVVVGVWAGNNNNTPMKKGGAAMAGPIWNKFMKEAIKVIPPESFETAILEYNTPELKPVLRGHWQGNESFTIDMISGGLATEFTPLELRQERVITNVHNILHWVDRNDIMGPPPANPENNPQYRNWEVPVRNWWARNGGGYNAIYDKPTSSDQVHTDANRPTVVINEPNSITEYPRTQRISLNISTSGAYSIEKIDIFINGMFRGSSPSPVNFSFSPSEIENLQAVNEIRVIVYDAAFNRGEAVSTFKVAP
jgi:penicillin-binding protein 1C